MIVEQIVTNLNNLDQEAIDKRHIEKVYLESTALTKRIMRMETDHGRDIGIRLKEPSDMQAGDVLYMDDDTLIVIDTHTDDVLVISPRNINEMGTIAHQLGNRHLPAQFEADDMVLQYDYLVEELLKQMDLPYKREERKMKEPFRHVEHTHV